MGFDTAASILNDAAVELGLLQGDSDNPFNETDVAIMQLCRFLKSLGQDLVKEHPWTHLQKEHTFNTVASTAAYALPADFDRMVAETHWNRTGQQALLGPVGPRVWQAQKAQSVDSALRYTFRTVNNEVQLYPTPSAVDAIHFEYISTYWVRPTAQAAPTTATPTAATDVIHFDRRLIVTGLKWTWLRNNGFESTAAQQDFSRLLIQAKGADGAAPVVRVGGRRHGTPHMIDGCNVPETGFGS